MIEGIGRGQPPRAVSAASAAPQTSGADGGARTGTAKAGAPGLSGIARELSASPPVDAAKVERLRAGVVSGSYRADPDAIAAAMIGQETFPPRG